MKKLAIAVALAALSGSASAYDMYAAVRLTDNEGTDKSYVLNLNTLGGLTSSSLGVTSITLPTELQLDLSSGTYEGVHFDVFGTVYNENSTTTTEVEITTTNNASVALAPTTSGNLFGLGVFELGLFVAENTQGAFSGGYTTALETDADAFFDSSIHGGFSSNPPLRQLDGTNIVMSGVQGESLALWTFTKATGDRLSNPRRGTTGTNDILPTSFNTSLFAELTGTSLNIVAGGAPVPVPAAVWLMGSALAGLGFIRRRSA